ncbi:MAG: AhpC/TSA family protein [Tannerella sp.]|jgi:peroxiredoxin|nr:AhpC/TSA family protein [Tannerella sp.]
MKNNYTYRLLAVCCSCIIIGGCRKSDEFTVKGVVAGASGQTLFLENIELSTVTVVDSLKLKPDGKFLFKQKRPEYPDFYRLKLKNQLIFFSVDSTETVIFTADAHNFATSYTVEGSENCKAIKEIRLAQLDANQEIHNLRDSYGLNLIPDTSTYQGIALKTIKSYKDIALKYIYGAPASPAAYFALFQQIDGLWFFDLYDRTDSRAYGAVATSYKTYYPGSPRAKQLETLALQSMKVTRGERKNALNINDAKEVNFIDIELPDINGNKIKLSNIAQGKSILVNFTAYQTEWSPTFNIQLNELYGKYKERGFEIYQISLDDDVHFWKNVASNIPWISVHDPQSIYSSIAAIYNVKQLPALFLLNKKGELVKRVESMDAMEDDIKSAL